MPKVPLTQFLTDIVGKFPNLKQYDETRLFSVLMQVGVNVEFDFDPDGNTVIEHGEINKDAGAQLSQM
ncbi:MAG: hypothetical protein WEB62_01605 [Bacteroidota bacterium]